MPDRERLPDRRMSITIDVHHNGHAYTASAGLYPDGRIGEVWIDPEKQGSDMSIALHDVATVASLALQHGCPATTIIAACQRHEDGSPAGVLGAAMAAIMQAVMESMIDA